MKCTINSRNTTFFPFFSQQLISHIVIRSTSLQHQSQQQQNVSTVVKNIVGLILTYEHIVNVPGWFFFWSLLGCWLKKVQAFLNGDVMVFFQEAILILCVR